MASNVKTLPGPLLCAAVLICSVSVCWRGYAAPPEVEDPPFEQVFNNIQVLNGVPASQKDGIMSFMAASLGVGCTHCHVNPWQSDDRPAKLVARRMILMTRSINQEDFAGRQVVTCFTCHQGHPQPPAAADGRPIWQMLEPAAPPAQPTEPLPGVDRILDHYIRALGGVAAIDRLRTRIARGTQTSTNRMSPARTEALDVIQAAPDRLLTVVRNSRGVTQTAFSGARGWSSDARGRREISGEELADGRIDADFFQYLKLRETYPTMAVSGREILQGRDVYVVDAARRSGPREKLYFDARSGLLIRRYVPFFTVFGVIPEVTDFSNYRNAGGLMLPFTIAWSRPPFASIRNFSSVRINQPVDFARFDGPRDRGANR